MSHDFQHQEFGSTRRLWHFGWDIGARLPTAAILGLVLAVPHPVQAKVFNCAAGDTVCLINAIDVSNGNGQKNTIRLAAGSYTVLALNNDTNGPNGLPSITSTLRIEGVSAAATSLGRGSSATDFRLIHVGPTGKLTIDGVTLTGGRASNGKNGGGVFNDGGLVNISESVVSGNTCGSGCGVFNDGGVVNISGTIISGNLGTGGVGLFNNDGAVTISWSTFANNGAMGGGGIDTRGTYSTLHINDSRFTNNNSFHGGGALNAEGGNVFITNSTFDHNIADGSGAINVGFSRREPVAVIVTDSAFTDNLGSEGSGIGIFSTGLAVVTNTTFARNVSFIFGTAAIETEGHLLLLNSTLADNTSGGQSGYLSAGLLSNGPGAFTILVNTILGRNTARGLSADCNGSITSLGHNLIGALAGCEVVLQLSDLIGISGLGAFTDNGVPGNGHFPLLPASQAVDAGDDVACPRTDQIGEKRKAPCDIGAIEYRKNNQPKDSIVSRIDGSNIVGDLIDAVTALKSPAIGRDESSRQLKSVLDLAENLFSTVSSAP